MNKISLSAQLKSGFFHGADYNPDQWRMDESIVQEDFDLMQQANCTSMSVGIFSWTQYEPEEGNYQFDWMDQLLDRMHRQGIKAFLATPSGSKPMWMQHKYPEIRRITADGLHEAPGFRHNHCPSSEIYREKVRQLNTQLATRYGKHPALALWHVGNELQGECFCEHCLTRFRLWLKERYVSLDAVNEAWWSGFWNHTLTDWEQIDPRDPSVDGMLLDWKRFVNVLHVEFLQNEMAPLRELSPDTPCTTNYMIADAPLLNYGEWSKVIDVISNDAYPNYFGPDANGNESEMLNRAARFSFVHDLTRGMNDGKAWMLIECSPSMVNWTPVNKLKPKGMHQLEALQAIAHGADTIHYFQWRKGRGGFEKQHGAVIDHDPRTDTRIFKEVSELGHFLQDHSALANSQITENSAVMLYDWESLWAMNTSCGVKQPSQQIRDIVAPDAYHKLIHDHYRGAWTAGLGIDALIVDPDGLPELSQYQLIMAPANYLLRDRAGQCLLDLVKKGATLVLSHHSASVNEFNQVHRYGLPGAGIHEAAGVKVEEVDSLYDDESIRISIEEAFADAFSGDYTVTESYGCLYLQGAEVVARYGSGPWENTVAITRKQHGKGQIWMVGGYYCDPFYTDLYKMLVRSRKISRVIEVDLPEGVTATKRVSTTGEAWLFIINYTQKTHAINLPAKHSYQRYQKKGSITEIELPPYGTAILQQL